MTNIAARFRQRVGRLLNPLIPLYNVPPPCNADDDKMDLTVVEINNPPGDANECNNDRVVLFDVLTALPALNKPLKNDNNDDALPTALGLLANGSNAVALTTVSLGANRIDAPPALEEDDAAGAGLGGVDGIPVGDGATGDDGALGPPANGSAVTPALAATPAISTRRAAPLALPDALGSPADANGFAGGHVPSKGAGASAEDDDAACAGSGGVDGIPVGNCATGNHGALVPPANGSAVPPALIAAPAITTGSTAPLASPDALGSPANANGLAGEHEAMDEGSGGNACAAIMDGATGDHLPSPTATGGADPLASHTALNGLDDGGDAPPEFSTDVGLPADENGLTGIGDAADAGSGSIIPHAAINCSLSPLLPQECGGGTATGCSSWVDEDGSAGEPSSGSRGRAASECRRGHHWHLAGGRNDQGSCPVRPWLHAGREDHRGSCLARPWPPAFTHDC
jgi:hypothetical protein